MTLYERMQGWMSLLAKREDLVFQVVQERPGVAEPSQRYAEDARDFAKKATQLFFSWHLKDDRSIDGFLNLDLRAFNEPSYMLLDGARVNEDDMLALDVDVDGIGEASWYLAPPGQPPRIVWSVEELVCFPSLTDYLTRGAKQAFSYGGSPWQRGTSKSGLAPFSVADSTPPERLQAALVQRGASETLASSLLEWLGSDVRYLLPK